MMATLYSLGHSKRQLDDLERLLGVHGIGVLADIRRFPRSRSNPQFNIEQLARALPAAGIRYTWLASLGGRRRSRDEDATNAAWRNSSFRAFADYMLTDEFEQGMGELLSLARECRVAMMCAEAVPWRCHRSLIADALTVRGVPVVHILDVQQAQRHTLTSFARVQGVRLTYPESRCNAVQCKARDHGG